MLLGILYTSKEQVEVEIERITPFTLASKKPEIHQYKSH